MLVVEPGLADDPELGRRPVAAAEAYLRSRGRQGALRRRPVPAQPLLLGPLRRQRVSPASSPSTPPSAGPSRPSASAAAASTVLMELALADWREPRDPKPPSSAARRSWRSIEDALIHDWWDALALEPFRPTAFHLISKADGTVLARATTWDMAWFGRDGRTRAGLIAFDVEPARRRAGYGRLLVGEILRHARAQLIDVLAVQTGAANAPALALYESAGFARVGTSTLYRLPGESEPPAPVS